MTRATRRSAGDVDPRAIRKKPGPLRADPARRQRPRDARSRGKEQERPLGAPRAVQDPAAVRRDRHPGSRAQPHGRGAVPPREIGRVLRSASLAALVEKQRAAVRRHFAKERPVQPGQGALAIIVRGLPEELDPGRVAREQGRPIRRNVDQGQASRHLEDRPLRAGQIDREDGARPFPRAREPDFLPSGGPRQAAEDPPAVGELAHPAVRAHQGQRAGAVSAHGVIEECDRVAAWGDSDMADPAGGLVFHAADRELDPRSPGELPHDSERFAVGGPVRIRDVLQQLARRPAGEGNARERAPLGSDADRELSGGRDTKSWAGARGNRCASRLPVRVEWISSSPPSHVAL